MKYLLTVFLCLFISYQGIFAAESGKWYDNLYLGLNAPHYTTSVTDTNSGVTADDTAIGGGLTFGMLYYLNERWLLEVYSSSNGLGTIFSDEVGNTLFTIEGFGTAALQLGYHLTPEWYLASGIALTGVRTKESSFGSVTGDTQLVGLSIETAYILRDHYLFKLGARLTSGTIATQTIGSDVYDYAIGNVLHFAMAYKF